MASKRHTPEQIVAKLRQVDVLTSQGTSVADAIRSIGVTEVTYRRTAGRGDLLQPARGRDHHRELAQAFQCGTPARLSEISGHRRPRCSFQRSPRGRRRQLDQLFRPRSR
jgi:hypothetical protein